MHIAGPRKGRRNLSFELNLVPFIDVLSTCICFLLVTTVFLNLGAFHVNQAIGDAKSASNKKTGTVTLSMGAKGDVRFEMKDIPAFSGRNSTVTIAGQSGQVNFEQTERFIQSFSSKVPEVKVALIMPNPSSHYNDIIQLMSQLKKNSLDQIGIAPL